MTDYLNIDGSEEVMMNQAAYSFDFSVTSIYPGLTHGATLFSLSKKTLADYKELFRRFAILILKYGYQHHHLQEYA